MKRDHRWQKDTHTKTGNTVMRIAGGRYNDSLWRPKVSKVIKRSENLTARSWQEQSRFGFAVFEF